MNTSTVWITLGGGSELGVSPEGDLVAYNTKTKSQVVLCKATIKDVQRFEGYLKELKPFFISTGGEI